MTTQVEEPKFAFDAMKKFGEFSTLNPKKVTAIHKIINFGTDSESVENLGVFLEKCKEIKDSLPVKDSDVDTDKLKNYIETADLNLTGLNGFISFIDQIFDKEKGTTKEIIIDDPNMNKFFSIIHELKDVILYISEYSKLVLSIQETKKNLKTKGKKYTYEEFISALYHTPVAA